MEFGKWLDWTFHACFPAWENGRHIALPLFLLRLLYLSTLNRFNNFSQCCPLLVVRAALGLVVGEQINQTRWKIYRLLIANHSLEPVCSFFACVRILIWFCNLSTTVLWILHLERRFGTAVKVEWWEETFPTQLSFRLQGLGSFGTIRKNSQLDRHWSHFVDCAYSWDAITLQFRLCMHSNCARNVQAKKKNEYREIIILER